MCGYSVHVCYNHILNNYVCYSSLIYFLKCFNIYNHECMSLVIDNVLRVHENLCHFNTQVHVLVDIVGNFKICK